MTIIDVILNFMSNNTNALFYIHIFLIYGGVLASILTSSFFKQEGNGSVLSTNTAAQHPPV